MLSPFLLAIFVSTIALGALTGIVYKLSTQPLDGPPSPADTVTKTQSWGERFRSIPERNVQMTLVIVVAVVLFWLERRASDKKP
jgi:hypothetical protein